MRRWGNVGKHLEIYDLFNDARRKPATLAKLAESDPDAPHFLRDFDGLQEASTGGGVDGRVDFPIFLQTIVRHRLRQRFTNAAAQWQRYVGVESAQDFREHTVSELRAFRGIEGVPEFGEYPRLRTGEAPGPSYAVGKYGGIYALTFELVINDQVNELLNRIPAGLGQSMSDFVNQAVVALIESNPTYGPDGQPFFGVAHDNNITGAAAEITGDNLVAVIDKLRTRRDEDGIPMNVQLGRILVRNPSQKFKIDQLVRSQQTGIRSEITASGAPDFPPSTYNPLANVIPADAVIEDVWLNDVNDWYVLANADDRPAFVIAFLRNRREPYIFLKDSGMRGLGGNGADPYDMDYDEIPYKIRHVFGLAPGEPHAAIRMQP